MNFTSPVPRFAVSTLAPGQQYIVSISAFNGKGRSEATVFQASTLRLPEKQLTLEKGNNFHYKQFKTSFTNIFSFCCSFFYFLFVCAFVAGEL